VGEKPSLKDNSEKSRGRCNTKRADERNRAKRQTGAKRERVKLRERFEGDR